jgi:rfaE bifunctional protein nucleotidyltransferase chain/domain
MIELDLEQYNSDNIVSEDDLDIKIAELKMQGKKIGMITGSFDLMHPGHITHINAAKKHCDILIASIAEDKYNQESRKTKGRPIYTDKVRAFVISQLKAVDFVIINSDSNSIIRRFKPHIYIKGSDWKGKDIREIPVAKEVGAKMIFTETEKLSTTGLIKYVKEEIE